MKVVTTRTLNPLPFQDLEPHRFEDLVRQLAYEFRRWKSLEATGRAGSDEGIDIRAIELVRVGPEPDDADDADDDAPAYDERLWIFQCKREKTLSPKAVRSAVAESLASAAAPPHGFVLAIGGDVSKKARDAFREEMVARGIEEFAIWARGELEDMLVQPRNDRLLFAYFGLSLSPRRRSVATELRTQLARKKQLFALLEGEERFGKLILLRDPGDDRYPYEAKAGEPPVRWLARRALSAMSPGHLVVVRHEYLAATTPDGSRWDAILSYDHADTLAEADLGAVRAWRRSEHDLATRAALDFWHEYIAEQDQAFVEVTRWVPFGRILAIDPLGDGHYPVPHVFVEFDDVDGPFAPGEGATLEHKGANGYRLDLAPEKANRAKIFPTPLPGELDPEPLAFDNTLRKTVALSPTTETRLRNWLAPAAPAKKPDTPLHADRNDGKRRRSAIASFLQWRKGVAQPLLSTFVGRLRKAGHAARVVVRSVEGRSESVEIRVRVRRPSAYNSSYRVSGHARISCSADGVWRQDLGPPVSMASRARHEQQQEAPKVEGMPKEQLEAVVLEVLERLLRSGS